MAGGILIAMRRVRAGSIGLASVAVMLALGAGCFSDRGVAIEVDVGDTGASTVELYLGKTRCDPTSDAVKIDCTAIAPPNGMVNPASGTVALAGTIWFRDGLLPFTAPVTSGKAMFHLQTDGERTLPIVIAVGLAATATGPRAVGTATMRDLAIPASGARIVTTTLIPAAPVVLKNANVRELEEVRVQVWTKDAPASSCVVVEHWRDGQVERDFVVPIEDPDCDDVAVECNPAAYRGTSEVGGTSTRPNCVARSEERCVLGNFGCSDLMPETSDVCVASPREICVPDEFCNCTALGTGCLRTMFEANPMLAGIPHIRCDVPAALPRELCGDRNTAMIDLAPGPATRSCGDQPLLASLGIEGFARSGTFGGAEFELSGTSDPCNFKITWKSGTLNVDARTEHGVVLLDRAGGGFLLPIVFAFHIDACISQFQCKFLEDPMDPLWRCVGP